jgi:hypothetical protein
MQNGGWLDSYDEELQLGGYVYPTNYVPQAENGIEGTMGGLTDQGFDYNGAWGGTMQMGGSMPGSVGFTYARTKGIPSNGPYAKKTLASAQDGESIADQMAELSTNMWGYPIEPNFVEAYKKPTKKTTSKKTPAKKETAKSKSVDEKKPTIDFINKRITSKSDETYVKKPVVELSPDELKIERLKQYAQQDSRKEQPVIQSPLSTPEGLNGRMYEQQRREEIFNSILKGADVATDVMQAGHFIPLPAFQMAALYGDVLGSGVDAFQAGMEARKGNYGNSAMNAASLAIPYQLGKKGYTRDMANTEAGSLADKIAGFGSRSGDYRHLTPLNRLKNNPVIKKGVNYNRGILGALGAETAYDSYQNGGEMKFYQEGLDWKPRNISKQGSKIKKDDNGYWNPDNWGEPVEIDSNQITMQGVYEPLLGISDTGDTQMMYPGEDYTFDGESVTEYPVAQDGETLLKNKKVGQLETEIAKLNLRPIYPDFKTKIEYVSIPGCPEGAGCSKQATVNAQNITGLPYVAYAPADAAYRDAVAKRTGLKNIFDQEGSQKTSADSRGKGWKYPTSADFKNWKAGDIVTLDAGSDYYFPYSAPKGYSSKDNYGQSHNGMIYGFTPEGRPIIKHGAAKGRDVGKSWTEVLGEDSRVTDLGHGRYAVKSVWRPKEVSDDGTINKIDNIVDLGKDAAKRKQDTTSNETFYLKNTDEERLMEDAAAAGEFSGASNRLNTKKKLVNLFNDKKLNKDLQYKFGITAEELDNLKPVVYGIFGQETNFNDIDSPGATIKEFIGNMIGGNSRGPAQIKLESLTPEERKILGVKKSSDLENDEVAYKAALLMLSNSKKRMDREVAQGTHPELANVDENFRAGYYYNSPARAINNAKDWGKKSKPSKWYNPLSWKNALTTRERPDLFGRINPNYANIAELRMDEGSYPYKLMENAKDLGVNVDFEKGRDLEEVVVRGTNKPKSKFVKKENGGWLDKYN